MKNPYQGFDPAKPYPFHDYYPNERTPQVKQKPPVLNGKRCSCSHA